METYRDQQPELESSVKRRAQVMVGGALLATVLAAGALWYLTRPSPPVSDRLLLHRATFADLAGWEDDHQSAAIVALRRSCAPLLTRADAYAVGQNGIGGTAAAWRTACEAVAGLAPDDDAARHVLEAHFVPLRVTNNGEAEGLFTGYYEPELRGRRIREGKGDGAVPLYTTPPDLVTVDLGAFRESLKNQRTAGRVVDGRLEPFPDRAAIEGGALAGRGLEIAWVDDPIDAFFLHIQGSGRITLDDGSTMRVGYAGQNGHSYFAIGRELVASGELDSETVSLQTIRAWLRAHPARAPAVMATNRSYIFFRELDEAGPVGAQGVVLTPQRSLAVDRRFLPLGAPVWLDASAPSAEAEGADVVLRQLMVTQDTGGAIRGPVRGDVFWGHGREAEEVAGRMKHRGRYYLLLPVAVVERLERAGRVAP